MRVSFTAISRRRGRGFLSSRQRDTGVAMLRPVRHAVIMDEPELLLSEKTNQPYGQRDRDR